VFSSPDSQLETAQADADISTARPAFPLAFYAALIVALLAARAIATLILPVYDDAFITYRYARNLAGGQGFVYHPREWVLGATCPAFGVLAALFYRLGLQLPSAIVTLNILCDAAILALTCRILASRSAAQGALTALLFGFFFAISPILARICVGGMEMNLFLLGSLGAILLFHRGAKIPAIALAALCYFLRPEGVLLVVILSALELFSTRRLLALRLPLVAAAIWVPLLLLIHRFYGHILPQSVTAKSHAVNRSVLGTAKSLIIPDAVCLLLLPLTLWGMVAFLREKSVREAGFLRTLLLWYGAYLCAYLLARPQIWSWYAEPIQFVQIVFAALGAADLIARWPLLRKSFFRQSAPPLWMGLAPGVLAVAFWLLVLGKSGPSGTTRYVYAPLQRWGQSAAIRRSSILAEDIGAVGFYSNAYIYDTAGLVWPAALRYKSLDAIIKAHRPDYLFLNADRDTLKMMAGAGLNGTYQPVERFSINGETNPQLDAKRLPTTWKQDYVLFKRRREPGK